MSDVFFYYTVYCVVCTGEGVRQDATGLFAPVSVQFIAVKTYIQRNSKNKRGLICKSKRQAFMCVCYRLTFVRFPPFIHRTFFIFFKFLLLSLRITIFALHGVHGLGPISVLFQVEINKQEFSVVLEFKEAMTGDNTGWTCVIDANSGSKDLSGRIVRRK